jgi:hypothetical protein
MFSILISANDAAWESEQRLRMSLSRFLEYSGDEAEAISAADPSTLKALEHASALLMYETEVNDPPGETVRVGQLRDVRVHQGDVTFRFVEDGRLKRKRVLEERHRFQLAETEFSRTHWAVKDGELPQDLLCEMVETPRRYDIALSFASEDRQYVEAVASKLEATNVSVFYDRNEEASLWGKDLVEHLDLVYRTRSRYCIMFVSRHYAEKMWTSHERRSAMTRSVEQRTEYILPVRFDDTEVPGLRSTVGYVDARTRSAEAVARLILQKLGRTAP